MYLYTTKKPLTENAFGLSMDDDEIGCKSLALNSSFLAGTLSYKQDALNSGYNGRGLGIKQNQNSGWFWLD